MDNLFELFSGKFSIFLSNSHFGFTLLICILWGILSVAFCPCHLASIPLIISYIKELKTNSVSYAFRLALFFGIGIFVVICSIGLITIGLGQILEEKESILDYIIGAIFVIVGFHVTGIVKYHHHDHCHEEEHDDHCGAPVVKYNSKGYIGAFVYGLIFGLLLSPCTFAYMAPLMGSALKKSMTNQTEAFLMFVFYGIGNAGIIILAGTFTEFISKYNHWSHDSKASKIIKIICGIVIILAGVHMYIN